MKQKITASKIAVLSAVAIFTLAWLGVNIKDFISTQNGLIRLVLGTLFSFLIIIRPKPEDKRQTTNDRLHFDSTLPVTISVLGVVLAVSGIVFNIHQVEWLGLLFLLGGGLSWATPLSCRKDIFLGLLLFYWIHPLPGVVFGSMQIFLQKASVTLSEAFLHALNVRVWADGLVLRTGLNVYEIPSWCSGMRTASTVLILSFGLGVLKRLKWKHCILVMTLAVLQAVLLNVLRISSLVLAGPFSSDDANIDFLHDAAGIIIIAAVILVWIEISFVRSREHKSVADNLAPNTRFLQNLSELPPFWRVVIVNKGMVITLAVLVILLSIAGYRHRPSHRAEMIKSVVEHLVLDRDLENAARSADAVRSLVPNDKAWIFTVIRIHIMREQYNEALALIPSAPDDEPDRITEKKIMKAYSCMGLKDFDTAAEVIETIPDELKTSNPMLAMIMAEVGMYSNNPDQIEKYLSIAKSWEPNFKRIRRLYPYLRNHRKWSSITSSDSTDIRHDNLSEALCATDAYMHENDSVSIASILMDAIKRWPHEPRLLTPLFFMVIKRDSPEWESRYSNHLIRFVLSMNDPDPLYSLFDNCFRISRPDLAWTIYHRIEELDPTHPALALAAINYGQQWFLFRKQYLGIRASSYYELIDVRHIAPVSNNLPDWEDKFSRIPLRDELSNNDHVVSRKKFIQPLLLEFEKRKAQKNLSDNMMIEYVRLLSIVDSDIESASKLISSPELSLMQTDQKALLSQLYEEKGNWYQVYESLHDILPSGTETSQPPPLSLLIRLCKAQTVLRLGISALHTAQLASDLYPDSTAAMRLLSRTLLEFISPEESLHVLMRELPIFSRDIEMMKAFTLHKTQRFNASKEVCQGLLVPALPIKPGTGQSIVLPPAEIALQYHQISTPSSESFMAIAEHMRTNLKSSTSRFITELLTEWLNTYAQQRYGDSQELAERWSQMGRTPVEKATALHQLAMLMCFKKEFEIARLASAEGLRHLPQSTILWRMLISLSEGDPAVIADARRACPSDSEIWLAMVVAREQRQEEKLLTADYSGYTAEALTRAAEYLLRSGRIDDATSVARQAAEKAQSLLPSYVVGVRCGLLKNDNAFTTQCVKGCIDSALTPLPAFYETFVTLKSGGQVLSSDPEMIYALKRLREQAPDNLLWAEMLGYVQFMSGGDGMIDAMYHLTAAIDAGSKKPIVFILAAETARQLGNLENAVAILKTGLNHHPDDSTMLNNLVFTLSQSEDSAPEAMQHLSRLRTLSSTSTEIQDTIALALIRNNKLDEAEAILENILKTSSANKDYWFRANLRLVEIAIKRNNDNKANTLLKEIINNTGGINDADVKAANKLDEILEGRRQNE